MPLRCCWVGNAASFQRRVLPVARSGTPGLVMMADDGSPGTLMRVFTGLLIAGVVLTGFLPLSGALKNATVGEDEGAVSAQLSKVPLFTVTDETGRPFLAETKDRKVRLGYFFVQPKDANEYLNRVEADAGKARVLTVGLDEAVKYLDTKRTAVKAIPERFEIFPDSHEVDVARDVTGGVFSKTFGENGVPLFFIDGLALQSSAGDGGPVYPLFFEKETLDETLASLQKNDPKTTITSADIQVIDLRQTIREIRAGGNPRLNRVVFVPLTESLQAMRKTTE